MTATSPHPRVGVAVLITNLEGKFVMGKRKGSHGAGTWQFPGGHLEMGESFFSCAEREAFEETGLCVEGCEVIAVTNDVFDESKHYITIFVKCRKLDAKVEPSLLEPDKCEGWHWINWETVREWCRHHENSAPEWADKKCFLPIVNLVKGHYHPENDSLVS